MSSQYTDVSKELSDELAGLFTRGFLNDEMVDTIVSVVRKHSPSSTRKVNFRADRANRLYLAGPMTGYEEHNYPAFNAKAAELRAEGWDVINPADHGIVAGAGWADYLRYDIASIAECETIALLPGWSRSKGAQLETYVAEKLGMRFIFTDGAERHNIGYIERDRPALDEWLEKTDWLRGQIRPAELGRHLADVLTQRHDQAVKVAEALLFLVDAMQGILREDGRDGNHEYLGRAALRIAGCTVADLQALVTYNKKD